MIKARYFADAPHVDKEMPNGCQVIFFDAAGTLIYLPQSVGEHYRRVAIPFGIAPSATDLDRAFRAAWKAAPERPAGDGPRPDDDKGWWRELVSKVFDAVLADEEKRRFNLPAYFEAVYAHFAVPGVWAAYDDVPFALAKLRAAGYRLGIISNFDKRLHRVLVDLGLAVHFEHVVLSSEVGADKPDPRIFHAALSRFEVAADATVHVGDDPRKDGGAEAAGLRVFQLERPRQTLRDLAPFLAQAAFL